MPAKLSLQPKSCGRLKRMFVSNHNDSSPVSVLFQCAWEILSKTPTSSSCCDHKLDIFWFIFVWPLWLIKRKVIGNKPASKPRLTVTYCGCTELWSTLMSRISVSISDEMTTYLHPHDLTLYFLFYCILFSVVKMNSILSKDALWATLKIM